MLSLTIRQSIEIFSQKTELLSLFVISLVLAGLPKNLLSQSFWRKLCFSACCLTHNLYISAKLSVVNWLISNFHLLLVALLILNFLTAAKFVSLINIELVVEHILILIPLIFHTNVQNENTHTSFFKNFYMKVCSMLFFFFSNFI